MGPFNEAITPKTFALTRSSVFLNSKIRSSKIPAHIAMTKFDEKNKSIDFEYVVIKDKEKVIDEICKNLLFYFLCDYFGSETFYGIPNLLLHF